MSWGWPQWVYAGLVALTVITHISKHGDDYGQYNGITKSLDAALVVWLLYMGGFWTLQP